MIAAVTVMHPERLRSLTWYFDLPENVALVAVRCHEVGAWRSDFVEVAELPAGEFITDAFEFRRWLERKA